MWINIWHKYNYLFKNAQTNIIIYLSRKFSFQNY